MATLYSNMIDPDGDGVANPVVRKNNSGAPVVAIASYTATAAASAGYVIQMVAVPNGAKIVDIIFYGDTADGKATLGVGDGSLTNRFGSATADATAATLNLITGLPYTISLSDNAAKQWDTIDLFVNAVTSATTGNIYTLAVTYVTDN